MQAMFKTQVWFLGQEKPLGRGHDNPFQHFCLENSMDRGAQWAPTMGLHIFRHDWSNLLCMHTHFQEQYDVYQEKNCDLPFGSFNNVKRLKKHRGWLQRRMHLNEKLISKIFLNTSALISFRLFPNFSLLLFLKLLSGILEKRIVCVCMYEGKGDDREWNGWMAAPIR